MSEEKKGSSRKRKSPSSSSSSSSSASSSSSSSSSSYSSNDHHEWEKGQIKDITTIVKGIDDELKELHKELRDNKAANGKKKLIEDRIKGLEADKEKREKEKDSLYQFAGFKTPFSKVNDRVRQTSFRDRVMVRNLRLNEGHHRCDICQVGGGCFFFAAHIIPHSQKKKLKVEHSNNPEIFGDSTYDTANCLFLCRQCDIMFETHLLQIDGKGSISINNKAFKSEDNHATLARIKKLGLQVFWKALIGKETYPSASMLDFRRTLKPAAMSKVMKKLDFKAIDVRAGDEDKGADDDDDDDDDGDGGDDGGDIDDDDGGDGDGDDDDLKDEKPDVKKMKTAHKKSSSKGKKAPNKKSSKTTTKKKGASL